MSPAIVELQANAEVPDEECFGPLLQVYRVRDWHEALKQAKATRFGLAAGLVGGTERDFEQLLCELPSGVVNWNRPTTGASGKLPFGGLGLSGNHRASAYHAADYCSDPVAIQYQHVPQAQTAFERWLRPSES